MSKDAMRKTFFLFLPALLLPQLEASEIDSPLIFGGTELRAGYRSDYIYRGRHVGSNVSEVQFSAGLALCSYCDFNFSGYVYQKLERYGFGNVGVYGEFDFYLPAGFHLVPFGALNEYRYCDFESGADWGLAIRQEISKSWKWEVYGLYDTGQQGSYGSARIHYFPLITDDVGLRVTVGTGSGYDYFETRGVNEFFSRVSVPVRVTAAWNVEPFVGVSNQQGQRDDRTRVYAGVWMSYMY